MKARRPPRREGALALLALPATLYLAIVYGLPLLLLLGRSVFGDHGFSIANYERFFADRFNWRVIGNTLEIAGQVTVVSLLLGFPIALTMARLRGFAFTAVLVALILPLSVGVVVKAFAWQVVLRRDGAVNQALQWLGLIDEPIRFLFTETGLILGAVNILLPFMILPIYSVVKLVDPRFGEAAASLGAPPLRRFLRVTLPLTRPGIVTGVAFVFSMTISMYVVPTLLIGDRYQTLATLTGRSFLFLRNEALGATTAAVLLILAVAVVFVSGTLGRSRWAPA